MLFQSLTFFIELRSYFDPLVSVTSSVYRVIQILTYHRGIVVGASKLESPFKLYTRFIFLRPSQEQKGKYEKILSLAGNNYKKFK